MQGTTRWNAFRMAEAKFERQLRHLTRYHPDRWPRLDSLALERTRSARQVAFEALTDDEKKRARSDVNDGDWHGQKVRIEAALKRAAILANAEGVAA